MCGRYYLSDPEGIFTQYGVPKNEYQKIEPDYNIAPGRELPVVLEDSKGRHLRMVKWGLIPSWAKDPKIGYKMINARMETLMEKPSWERPLVSQRALIPSNGFYEWKREGTKKEPFIIKAKDRELISFAGLYDIWKDSNGNLVPTFTIITAPADDTVNKIHDRMPVILTREGEEKWLDYTVKDPDLLENILSSNEDHSLESYKVSEKVNKPVNNSKDLLQPV